MEITARMVMMKNTTAMGLVKKISGLPSEMERDRLIPFSNMGPKTKAIKKGIADISKIDAANPNMPKMNIINTSNKLLLIE